MDIKALDGAELKRERCRVPAAEALLLSPPPNLPLVHYQRKDTVEVFAYGVAAEIRTEGRDRFRLARTAATDLLRTLAPDSPWRLFGGFSYRNHVEASWTEYGSLRFVLPVLTVEVEDTDSAEARWVSTALSRAEVLSWFETLSSAQLELEEEPDDETPASVSEQAYVMAVDLAADELASRDTLQKVVLARDVHFPVGSAPVSRFLKHSRSTEGRAFIVPATLDGAGTDFFVGVTPETLTCVENGAVRADALAGTRRRGAESELFDSRKERHEHQVVVDDIRDALEAVGIAARAASEPSVKTGPGLAHLWTAVEGEMPPGGHVLDVAEALHPTAAVCGFPRRASSRVVGDLETNYGLERGWYAGAVGSFDAAGDGEFFVAIRSARLRGQMAQAFVGAGIVEGSSGARELEETRLKLGTVVRALGGEHDLP